MNSCIDRRPSPLLSKRAKSRSIGPRPRTSSMVKKPSALASIWRKSCITFCSNGLALGGGASSRTGCGAAATGNGFRTSAAAGADPVATGAVAGATAAAVPGLPLLRSSSSLRSISSWSAARLAAASRSAELPSRNLRGTFFYAARIHRLLQGSELCCLNARGIFFGEFCVTLAGEPRATAKHHRQNHRANAHPAPWRCRRFLLISCTRAGAPNLRCRRRCRCGGRHGRTRWRRASTGDTCRRILVDDRCSNHARACGGGRFAFQCALPDFDGGGPLFFVQ